MQGNAELFRALGEIDPKQPYGTSLFDALARLTVSVAIEAVCLRDGYHKDTGPGFTKAFTEVHLVQRSLTDTAYPGQWHCPGSIMRPGESVEDVMKRLSEREFAGKILSYRFIENFNHPTEARGHFFSLLYLCHLQEGECLWGKWFSVHDLPEKTVGHHRSEVIPRVARNYPLYK